MTVLQKAIPVPHQGECEFKSEYLDYGYILQLSCIAPERSQSWRDFIEWHLDKPEKIDDAMLPVLRRQAYLRMASAIAHFNQILEQDDE